MVESEMVTDKPPGQEAEGEQLPEGGTAHNPAEQAEGGTHHSEHPIGKIISTDPSTGDREIECPNDLNGIFVPAGTEFVICPLDNLKIRVPESTHEAERPQT